MLCRQLVGQHVAAAPGVDTARGPGGSTKWLRRPLRSCRLTCRMAQPGRPVGWLKGVRGRAVRSAVGLVATGCLGCSTELRLLRCRVRLSRIPKSGASQPTWLPDQQTSAVPRPAGSRRWSGWRQSGVRSGGVSERLAPCSGGSRSERHNKGMKLTKGGWCGSGAGWSAATVHCAHP